MQYIKRVTKLTFLLGIWFHLGALPTRGDCQGGEVFGQTIYLLDEATLAWQAAADVDYVKGELSQAGSFKPLLRGSLRSATSLDTSRDKPSPGTGVFYIVKRSSPPCGSWQTTTGSEPERDMVILSPCSQADLTEQQLRSAMDAALAEAPSSWTNRLDALRLREHVQQELGCAIEEASATFETNLAFATDSLLGCDFGYCPGVLYCGDDNSEHGWSALWPSSSCLNSRCFIHDACYTEYCVTADELNGRSCIFSQRSRNAGCDAPLMFGACPICLAFDLALGPIGKIDWYNDVLVCEAMNMLTGLPKDQTCDFPACDGAACNQATGQCAATLGVRDDFGDGSLLGWTPHLEGKNFWSEGGGTLNFYNLSYSIWPAFLVYDGASLATSYVASFSSQVIAPFWDGYVVPGTAVLRYVDDGNWIAFVLGLSQDGDATLFMQKMRAGVWIPGDETAFPGISTCWGKPYDVSTAGNWRNYSVLVDGARYSFVVDGRFFCEVVDADSDFLTGSKFGLNAGPLQPVNKAVAWDNLAIDSTTP